MIEFDQNVYLSFKNITKMESHKQGITNFHATKENHEFIIKVIKINQKDRQNMQHFINQELLQSWRIKQNQKNKLSLKELIVMEKPHQYGYDYYIIRPYENRYTLRELLTKENKLLKQKQMGEIILKMLGLFVSTAHVNHVVMSADNIFLRNTCNGLQFAVNLTACTDYLFLEKGKQIKQHYFKEIAHYLHDHTFSKTHKFDFQLKIHCFSALLLQLILKMPLAFQNLPNNYNQLWARRQEMSEISLSYSKLLKLGNTQQQIKKIAQKLNISNCNLYQFLECILVVNQQNSIKAQNKFGNWAKIINLFLPNYFSKLIFRKQFPLQKIYRKQTEYSRKMYQKWKIIERIDQTQSVQQKDKGLKLYGLFKYGHLRQYRIDNGNRSQFNYFIVSDDVMMEVTEEEEHLGQTMLDFNSQGKYRKQQIKILCLQNIEREMVIYEPAARQKEMNRFEQNSMYCLLIAQLIITLILQYLPIQITISAREILFIYFNVGRNSPLFYICSDETTFWRNCLFAYQNKYLFLQIHSVQFLLKISFFPLHWILIHLYQLCNTQIQQNPLPFSLNFHLYNIKSPHCIFLSLFQQINNNSIIKIIK